MSDYDLWEGDPSEEFVLTREQVQRLTADCLLHGLDGNPISSPTFRATDTAGHREATHGRTVEHLRKARRELRGSRATVVELDDELDGWRGETGAAAPAPGHYAGDGYVTCSRAMEAAACQVPLRARTPLQLWWWLSAFKYVWRMWSKEDPWSDVQKAIGCLLRVAESLEGDHDER